MDEQALIARNLEIVAEHIENEARDPVAVCALYTGDIVQEFPARRLRFEGKDAIAANYKRMFGAIGMPEMEPVERFATPTRVYDDMIVRFDLLREGMDNAPVRIGKRIELRLVHLFHMRDGLISREIVHEHWRELE